MKRTFSDSEVSSPIGSLLFREDCGPGVGLRPADSSSKTFLTDSGVRSSFEKTTADINHEQSDECDTFGSQRNRFSNLKSIKTLDTHVEVIIDLNHRSVTTGPKTLYLDDSEFLVRCGLTKLNPEMIFDRLYNLTRTASSKHTRCSSTNLYKVFTNRFSNEIK